MKSRFLPPHTGQSSTVAGGLAAAADFLAVANPLAAALGWVVCAESAKAAKDTVRAIQVYRMFRLDAAARILFRNRGIVLMVCAAIDSKASRVGQEFLAMLGGDSGESESTAKPSTRKTRRTPALGRQPAKGIPECRN